MVTKAGVASFARDVLRELSGQADRERTQAAIRADERRKVVGEILKDLEAARVAQAERYGYGTDKVAAGQLLGIQDCVEIVREYAEVPR